ADDLCRYRHARPLRRGVFVFRLKKAGLCGALLVSLCLAAAGCGGSSPPSADIAKERGQLTRTLSPEGARRDGTAAGSREGACRAQGGRALSLLHGQRQSAAQPIILDAQSYASSIDEAKSELGDVPRGSLDAACLRVVHMLSAAESDYNDALNEWEDCDANN